MIYLLVSFWLFLGLIGAKWCLDVMYNDFKKIDNLDVFLAIITVIIGPIGLTTGFILKNENIIEKVFKTKSKLSERIQNYYQNRKP
jgi:hypothetical protein